jgi:ArsR family transcriptional regulator, arsenate/arsenite/antimonite-responsive transcriptional repressor
MQLPKAVEALSALGHASRLAVFRLLVRAGTEGMPAGEIACEVGVLSNTLSTHLTILTHANLIQSRKDGRSVIYSANYAGTGELLAFLVADCCAGRPEITNDILESPPRGEVGLQAERAQTVPLR